MIEHRDPFALVYARTSIAAHLRGHHRWPELAALMRLQVWQHPRNCSAWLLESGLSA
jgi:hypothetical protein